MKTYLIGAGKSFLQNIQQVLYESGIEDTHIFISQEVTSQELSDNASDAEILVASPTGFRTVSAEHMDAMPNLKLITTTSVGTDWVDLEAAKERGIMVSNEKGVNSEAVAEHCFGMILDVTKRITEADRDIRAQKHRDLSEYMGINIYGRTLGILGLGDIGKKVARIAKGFDMRVIGMNKSKQPVQGVELVDLTTLLKDSDIIAVMVPLNDETDNLLSQDEFSKMKDGVVLVSIAREKVINKQAVLNAVNSGKVRGFALDAEIGIPIPPDDPYLQSDKIVVTPHTASITEESDKAYATMTAENIQAFLDGKPIRVVN